MTTDPFPIARVTDIPLFHYFGYYGWCPWDAQQRHLLALEVSFEDRDPTGEDKATIGLVDVATRRFHSLATTRAWNFQQSSMMHWLPTAPDSEIIFNDRDGNRYVSVILNTRTGKRRLLPRPIAALSRDGKTAISLNFARVVKYRPGYGYAGLPDPFEKENAPAKDGVWLVDLETGNDRLVVSYEEMVNHPGAPPAMRTGPVWLNHMFYNTDSNRFLFLARWRPPEKPTGWTTSLFTSDLAGKDLRCLCGSGLVSHYDWRDPNTILVFSNLGTLGNKYYLVPDEPGAPTEAVGTDTLTVDGHCSYSPDGRWILSDTYPDREGCKTLFVWNVAEKRKVIVGRFYTPPLFKGEIRCDLHPRWSRDGKQICVDSVHEGHRQMYVIDVSGLR